MSNRHELVSNALTERLRELRAAVAQLVPADFGEMSTFVSQVQQLLAGAAAGEVSNGFQEPTYWLESDSDCLSSLRKLALGEPMQIRAGEQPQAESFLGELRSKLNESDQRFELLAQRYSCPLNFALAAENQARECVLERLMVQDRGRAEKNSIAVAGTDDLLLRLNLIAVYTCLNPDLRFLDALNYYYELIPSNWRPHAQHDWLLVSYFALYARALTARFVRK
jgi:hypothetical protein